MNATEARERALDELAGLLDNLDAQPWGVGRLLARLRWLNRIVDAQESEHITYPKEAIRP